MMSNLVQRILVGVVGIPLLLVAAVLGGWPLKVLIVILQAGLLWEWRGICRASGVTPNAAGMGLGVIGIDVFLFGGANARAAAVALVALAIMLLLDVLRRDRRPLRDLSAAALFLIYAALPVALWSMLADSYGAGRWEPMGALAVLFVVTWICDTAAYFVGKNLGRHKLDVKASPNKTVEGFVGGAISAAVVLPILAVAGFVRPDPLDYLALPSIVGLAGQVGDLLESLVKREVQIKDSSSLIPGHGGLLDRFDSLLLSAPLFLGYLILTVP